MSNTEKKALCLASVASHLDNFCRNDVKILQKLGYDVTLASNFFTNESNNSQEKINSFIDDMNVDGVHIAQIDFSRRVRRLRTQVKSYLQLKELLTQGFDLIHCHTPICAAMTRIAARQYRKKGTKVLYTAHGFHFFTGAPIKNWLIFYPVEWICSWWTDILITINKEDYARASSHLHAKKTVYVPGVGIDTAKFAPPPNGRYKIRKELGLADDQIMLLSVGELNTNKNHEAVIKALHNLHNTMYVIVGSGELEEHLKTVAKETGVDVRLTGYRTDVADFYNAADVYILPSLREGLNVSLMEAMASGLPIACGRIRGNTDLIDEDACLFDFASQIGTDVTNEIRKTIEYCITHRAELGQRNLENIRAFNCKSTQS